METRSCLEHEGRSCENTGGSASGPKIKSTQSEQVMRRSNGFTSSVYMYDMSFIFYGLINDVENHVRFVFKLTPSL